MTGDDTEKRCFIALPPASMNQKACKLIRNLNRIEAEMKKKKNKRKEK